MKHFWLNYNYVFYYCYSYDYFNYDYYDYVDFNDTYYYYVNGNDDGNGEARILLRKRKVNKQKLIEAKKIYKKNCNWPFSTFLAKFLRDRFFK